MSSYPPPPPPPGPGGVGRRIEEAVELIEMELRHAVAYVNDAVIPQVRRESISAMRTVADTLRSLADRMDQSAGGANSGTGPGTGSGKGPAAGSPESGPNSGPNSGKDSRF
jgi:hypothetical protein